MQVRIVQVRLCDIQSVLTAMAINSHVWSFIAILVVNWSGHNLKDTLMVPPFIGLQGQPVPCPSSHHEPGQWQGHTYDLGNEWVMMDVDGDQWLMMVDDGQWQWFIW